MRLWSEEQIEPGWNENIHIADITSAPVVVQTDTSASHVFRIEGPDHLRSQVALEDDITGALRVFEPSMVHFRHAVERTASVLRPRSADLRELPYPFPPNTEPIVVTVPAHVTVSMHNVLCADIKDLPNSLAMMLGVDNWLTIAKPNEHNRYNNSRNLIALPFARLNVGGITSGWLHTENLFGAIAPYCKPEAYTPHVLLQWGRGFEHVTTPHNAFARFVVTPPGQPPCAITDMGFKSPPNLDAMIRDIETNSIFANGMGFEL